MKNLLKTLVILLSLTAASLLVLSCSSGEKETFTADSATTEKTGPESCVATCCCNIDSLPFEPLSQEETEALLLMREEELLARDVYIELFNLYHVPVFANITRSEQQHTEAVSGLIEKYNLDDPAITHQQGIFVNQDLQQMYNTLVAQGQISRVEAYRAGATIEDLDIKDLMDLMESTDNQDIRLVFANLTKGSRNHLRSFSRLLLLSGVTYEPQFISPELYAWIIGSPHERGCING